ncbi:8-oxo-dGTP diphosphatase [Weissella beninensis]|uniref:NUDIX domain-containing protein n=1 Tax=Periweissella beninensis TaxID=504936 RepID=A0ABT0VG84_9LACO|nr:NUDIX domain-containing protein [Periweissella beninensis]MBM7543774.1 8-oxo-dGTP diphosphatase [Periweissella beninensis]MCM2436842.1 NUDIX domain-containing protein [Periweissella beninensis]
MEIFGEHHLNKNYLVRKGAYAIIFKDVTRTKIGLIRAHGDQYFLPGGGIEQNETPQVTLQREMLEESGYTLKNIKWLCRAQKYFIATIPIKQAMLSDGYFYLAQLADKKQLPSENDNHFEWVDVNDYQRLLFHEHQSYAVSVALAYYL